MSTSPIAHWPTVAQAVHVSADTLNVDLADGRSIAVPVEWYPRLANGTLAERNNWRFIGRGEGIHWPDLDEDISVEESVERCALGREPAVVQAMVGVSRACHITRVAAGPNRETWDAPGF